MFGHTALSMAAKGGHLDVVRMLVDAGADVNAVDNFGSFSSALLQMCQKAYFPLNDAKIVQILLDVGADINSRDGKGRSALQLAINTLKTKHETCALFLWMQRKFFAESNNRPFICFIYVI